jgi:hypothetical protein
MQSFRKFPAILGNPKVHHRVHKSPPLVPILSQFDPAHTISSYLSKIHFNIVHPPTSWSWHLILFVDLITQIIQFRRFISFMENVQFTNHNGHAVAQAVSRWLPTAAVQNHVRSACGVWGGQSSTGVGFVRVLRFPWPIIPPISPSSIIIIRGWHNRPISGRSAEWIQLDSTLYYTN